MEAVILNKAMSLVVVASALPFRASTVRWIQGATERMDARLMDPNPQLPQRLPDLSSEMRLFLAAVREDEIDNLKLVASLDEDGRQALQFMLKNFKKDDLAVINDSLDEAVRQVRYVADGADHRLHQRGGCDQAILSVGKCAEVEPGKWRFASRSMRFPAQRVSACGFQYLAHPLGQRGIF